MAHAPINRALTALLVLTLAGAAHAQDALGDGTGQRKDSRTGSGQTGRLGGGGHALDANPLVGSSGMNRRTIDPIWANIRYQNAIVTGNVTGGRSFRGDVGYTAANDFRGATAGQLVFDFNRDAFTSGVGLANLRGVGAARSSARFTTGGLRNLDSDNFIISRPGAGRDAGQVGSTAAAGAREFDGLAEIDSPSR